MKKLTIILALSFISIAGYAQKLLPELKNGSTATLAVDYNGQPIDLGVTLRIVGDVINIDWDASGTGGTYAMNVKGLESGTKFYAGQPQPDGVNQLADNETFMSISKTAYRSLIKNKSFSYGTLTYTLKDMPEGFKLGGQAVDAIYAATADGKTSLWILNSPDYPMTLQMKGNPMGIDYKVVSLK